MTTASTRLAYGNATPNSTVSVYTAPAGQVVIVKSISLHNLGGAAASAWVYAMSADSVFHAALFQIPTLSANDANYQETWVVLQPGEQLAIFCTQSNAYWISGAVLPVP